MRTGVVDEPVEQGGQDFLGLQVHSTALINFVDRVHTPITVGIQGEWGSGKTSLMNALFHHFDTQAADVKQIWINAWECSLLSTPEEALLKILSIIIEELRSADKSLDTKDKIKDGALSIFQGALRVGSSVALGAGATKLAEEIFSSSDKTISQLRLQLSALVNEIERRSSNPYKRVIVYVDDLDRIDPRHAVAILELLKNIFSIEKCVFVLAIDYQVVVKGLKEKFGEQTADNEWEFRAFFDKIIQLPFMMPMGQYDIGNYVSQLLQDVGFIENNELDQDAIKDLLLLSIGGNPRSIKRLINSVSLIQIFSDAKKQLEPQNDDSDPTELGRGLKKTLLFSLLCVQIAYPHIYSLLLREPDFEKWNDKFAFTDTQGKENRMDTFEQDYKAISETDDGDEDWEKALFRICYIRPRLRAKFTDLSRFLSKVKDMVEGAESDLGVADVISTILSETSVTNVTTTDQPVEQKQAFKKVIYSEIDGWFAQLDETGYPSQVIAAITKLDEHLKPHAHKSVYSKTAGITYYAEKNRTHLKGTGGVKIGGLNISGSKNDPKFEIRFLKNRSVDWRLPRIDGWDISHCRKFQTDKPATFHDSKFYRVILGLAEVSSEEVLSTIKKLAQSNLMFITEDQNPVFPFDRKASDNAIARNNAEVLNEIQRLLSDDHYYDFE